MAGWGDERGGIYGKGGRVVRDGKGGVGYMVRVGGLGEMGREGWDKYEI